MGTITLEAPVSRSELRVPEPHDMFSDRDLYRVEFGSGLLLFKLTHAGALVGDAVRPNREGRITPWWFPYEPASLQGAPGVVLPGVEEALQHAHRSRVAVEDVLRSRGAVKREWNPMTHLLVVGLLRPVTGLVGRVSPQLRSDAHSNVVFIGGGFQTYLGGMESKDVRVESFGPL